MRSLSRNLVRVLVTLALLLAWSGPALAAPWSSADLAVQARQADAAQQDAAAALAWQRVALLDPTAVPDGVPVQQATPVLPPSQWAWLFWGGLAVGLVGVVGLTMRRRRALPLAVSVLGAAVVTVSVFPLHDAAAFRRAAVVLDQTELHVSPAESSPSLATLATGSIVRVERAQPPFVQVRAGEALGWVPRSALTPVVPDA